MLPSEVVDERPAGRGGEVEFVIRRNGHEIDLAFPRNRFSMTPIQIGQLETLPGVLDVVQV